MPKYGLSLIRVFSYVGRIRIKYGYDSIHIRENTDQRKSLLSRNFDLRENISFVSARKLLVRECMNCLIARKLKAQK